MSNRLGIFFKSDMLWAALQTSDIKLISSKNADSFPLFFRMLNHQDTIDYGDDILQNIAEGQKGNTDLSGLFSDNQQIEWKGNTHTKAILLEAFVKEIQLKFEQATRGNNLKSVEKIKLSLIFSPVYSEMLKMDIADFFIENGFDVQSQIEVYSLFDKDVILNDFHVFQNDKIILEHGAFWAEKAITKQILDQIGKQNDKKEFNRQLIRAKKITQELAKADTGAVHKLKINTTIAPDYDPVSALIDFENIKEQKIADFNQWRQIFSHNALFIGFENNKEISEENNISTLQIFEKLFAKKEPVLNPNEYTRIKELDPRKLKAGQHIKLQNFDANPGKGSSKQEMKYIWDTVFEIVSSTRSLAPGDKIQIVNESISEGMQVDMNVERGNKKLGLFRTRPILEIWIK